MEENRHIKMKVFRPVAHERPPEPPGAHAGTREHLRGLMPSDRGINHATSMSSVSFQNAERVSVQS